MTWRWNTTRFTFTIVIALIMLLIITPYRYTKYNTIYRYNQPLHKRFQKIFVSKRNDTTTSIDEHYSNSGDNINDHANLKVYRGIHILATGRSGSSFLGQILAQNERVFYMFEPGRLVDTTGKNKITKSKERLQYYVNMIASIYHCQFKNMEIYLKALTQLSYEQRSIDIPDLSGSDQCNLSSAKCKPITSDVMREKCENKEFIVIKTIRILDIMNLTKLVKDDDDDFKILHLIRDPRGMILSKLRAFKPDVVNKMKMERRSVFDIHDLSVELYKSLDDWCKVWIKDASVGQQSWMAPKYMAVRYEDVALMPLRSAKQIYAKLGLGTVPNKVAKWIHDNTQTQKGGTYSVSRNSTLNADKWRRSITYALAKGIQDLDNCGKLMDIFGYIKVKSFKELNNSSLSLIGKY